MKLTCHTARKDRSGRHNDRNFDLSYAKHIDASKIKDDKYWTYTGVKDKNLNEIELDYYVEHFQQYIDSQNKRNIASGHSERNKTIKQYYKSVSTRPEDKIIQIGDRKEHVDSEILWQCALEYQKRFNEIFGEHCKILTMALHVDEATPHVHIRRVWTYEDENKIKRVGQSKSLEKLGILPKDPTQKESRFNNSKITFTEQERALFRQICLEKSIELEPDEPSKRPHLSVKQYKEAVAEIDELERTINAKKEELEKMNNEIETLNEISSYFDDFFNQNIFRTIYENELKEVEKKVNSEKLKIYLKLLQKEVEKIKEKSNLERSIETAKTQKQLQRLEHKVKILNDFIAKKNLTNELLEELLPKEDNKEKEI